MRVLVATMYTIPGRSGGWTTPLDLLGTDNEATYAVCRGRPGRYCLEGVEVLSPFVKLPPVFRPPIVARFVQKVNRWSYTQLLRKTVESREFDYLLCLEPWSAVCAQSLGYRYVLRFHDHPQDSALTRRALSNAFLVTSVDPAMKGAHYVPHAIDLSRYTYNDFPDARSAVLVAALDPATSPCTFVRGVGHSELPGVIYGDGSLRGDVRKACNKTGDRVRYAGPVTRLELNGIYAKHQVGVACINRKRNPYIMKISEYQACGLFPVVQKGTHLSLDAPELCRVFESEEELTEQVNRVRREWKTLGSLRRANRAYVEEHYDVRKARRIYSELLGRAESEKGLSIT